MSRVAILCALLLVGLNGCATEPKSANETPNSSVGHYYAAAEPIDPKPGLAALYMEVPVSEKEAGTAPLLPPPAPRTRIRMHIDQLKSSIKTVTGGVEWSDSKGNSYWTKHYTALGVPDYISSVNEVFETTLLFDKLLGDASRDVCPALLAKDKALPMAQRVFLTKVELSDTLETHPNEIEMNLSYLRLRFHGRHIPAGDARLAPWKTLFSKSHAATENTETAWTAVCVALLTHPEFASW